MIFMVMRLFKLAKDFILYTRILSIFSPFNKLFLFLYNFNTMRSWISKNQEDLLMNDFYVFERHYDKRYEMFEKIIQHYDLDKSGVLYLEFGVAQALSFKWWINRLKNQNSKFIGFDTFEGLPEDWGTFFKKGDMLGNIPNLNDDRATFVKGIFQDTLNNYIDQNKEDVKGKRKIIHMDADLFSATIFTLSQFYPYLNKGDIILFDEFNVANHEYFAFKIFTEAYYVKLKPIAAINNFYQVAFVVE